MTSKPQKLVVFAYLPGQTTASPAGILHMLEEGTELLRSEFVYGKRYAKRSDALAVDPIALKLPTKEGEVLRPTNELTEFGAFRDSAPDMWGRRVIENKLRRIGPLPEAEYLLHAGPLRVGALDFRADAWQLADIERLRRTVELIENGESIPPSLERCLDPGSSMGGARPKMVLTGDSRLWLAKFPSRTDLFDVPAVERATPKLCV